MTNDFTTLLAALTALPATSPLRDRRRAGWLLLGALLCLGLVMRSDLLDYDMAGLLGHLLSDHAEFLLALAGGFTGLCLLLWRLWQLNRRHEEMEQRLRAQQARLRAVLAALPDAACIVDHHGRLSEVLAMPQELFPEPPRPGSRLDQLLPAEPAALWLAGVRAAVGSGETRQVNLRIGDARHELRIAPLLPPVETEGRPPLSAPPRSQEAVCLARNVTRRHQLEAATQAARLEAEALSARLTSLDEAKTTLLAAVSQEIRMPLTAILGFVKLVGRDVHRHLAPALREQAGDKLARVQENLRIVEEEGRRLSRLMEHLVEIILLDSGQTSWRRDPVHLEDLARETADAARERLRRAPEVSLRLELAAGLPPLPADPARMRQLLATLLDHALSFTAAGEVVLRLEAEDDTQPPRRLRIVVEDASPALPQDQLDRLFDTPLPRPAQAPRGRQGDGLPEGVPRLTTDLGLALCKRIVAMHGGEIAAESCFDGGLRITALLPLGSRGSLEAARA